MEKNTDIPPEDLAEIIPELSEEAQVYVRPVAAQEVLDEVGPEKIEESGLQLDPSATLYAVHLEDGRRMAVFSDREMAFATARLHGATPLSVH